MGDEGPQSVNGRHAMADKSYRIHIRQGEFELDVEGDRTFVETYIEAFFAEEAEGERAPRRRARPKGAARSAPAARPSRRAVPEVDKAALAERIGRTKPVSNKERYLQYMRFWKTAGVDEVSDAFIHACFEAEGLAIPPTGRQNFSNLRDEGLVENGARRGYWRLTDAGTSEAYGTPGRPAPAPARGGTRRKGARRAAAAERPRSSGGKSRRRRVPKSVEAVMAGTGKG